MTSTSSDIRNLFSQYRFRSQDEAELQRAIEGLFRRENVEFQREVVLTAHDRIDFMVGKIGVEVKVGHALAKVIRQLHRYAQLDAVAELVLVTTRCRHALIPERINEKPITVIFLSWGALG